MAAEVVTEGKERMKEEREMLVKIKWAGFGIGP